MTPPSATGQPRAVASAVRLIYVTLGISLARTALNWSSVMPNVPPTVSLILLAVLYGVPLWLTSRVARGRNWARILYLAFFVLGLPSSIQALLHALGSTPLSGVLGIVQLGLQGVCLVLLFSAQARPWFRGAAERERLGHAAPTKA